MLSNAEIQKKFPMGEAIRPTKSNLEFAIENGLVLEVTYLSSVANVTTLRDVRIYSYGKGNGKRFKTSTLYARIWQVSGESYSRGFLKSTWRTFKTSRIGYMMWLGKRFNSAVGGYRNSSDRDLNLITYWQKQSTKK